MTDRIPVAQMPPFEDEESPGWAYTVSTSIGDDAARELLSEHGGYLLRESSRYIITQEPTMFGRTPEQVAWMDAHCSWDETALDDDSEYWELGWKLGFFEDETPAPKWDAWGKADAALADAAARAGVYVPPDPINPDPINPNHYRQGPIECIDAMRACSTREEYEGHLRLTVIKYLWRLRDKGDAVENARKAQWYLGRLVESLEGDE